ncbi:uncharacterized protein SCODWIG_02773 [Saccharomycodes ludwigii]|uniref:PA14 domain-containing protein n=1 Tax=Saccharomycodes ludwigii TaxID=36035 RepID=A0A376B8L4_9ASCO|nr:uncharacterized protein SCODWIG_02773 [Saccharomycodes ludwigii]
MVLSSIFRQRGSKNLNLLSLVLVYLHFYISYFSPSSYVSAIGIATDGTVNGCNPDSSAISSRTSGFQVKFYNYNWLSYSISAITGTPDRTTYLEDSYIEGGYVDQGMFAQVNDATNLTYLFELPAGYVNIAVEGTLPSGFGYTEEFFLTNWAMVATGYFVPPVSGSYLIQLQYVDDLGIVSLGAGIAFDCCMESGTSISIETYQVYSLWTANGPSGTNQIQVDLIAGVYYPIRLFYVNTNNDGGLELGYTGPDGVYHNEWDDIVFNMADSSEVCDAPVVTTTVGWSQNITSTYTTTTVVTSKSSTITENIVIIETPDADVSSTTTQQWTGTYTTTYATSITTYVGADGFTTLSTLYYVETPAEISTTTNEWTGTYTSTYSTGVTTIVGSDGLPTTSTLIYIETPAEISTTTMEWTGTYTSTYSTGVTTIVGSDGFSTTSTLIYIETPEAKDTTTTYTPWTGTYTSTIGTSVTTSVGSDGIPTTSTIYTVETPEVEGTTTTYTPWTGTYTSTIGTSVTTSIGSDGIPTTSTIYTCYYQYWIRWYSNYLHYLHS